MKQTAFAACHPAVNLLYFILVLAVSAFLLHPLFLTVSLAAAFACAVQCSGGGAVRQSLRYLVPTALFAALVNLACNHAGATILCYLPTGNPLTLESAAYSLAAAGMLASVLAWFSCWNCVMSADKLMHLFARAVPALSLVLSMTLRFVPRFQTKFQEMAAARRAMGRGGENGRLARLRETAAVFSAMLTWSLENAVETADSMKSRGFGLGRRTAFSLYAFQTRDRRLLVWIFCAGAYLAVGLAAGGAAWRYYPTLRFSLTPQTFRCLVVYTALAFTPWLLQRKEARAWNSTASKT